MRYLFLSLLVIFFSACSTKKVAYTLTTKRVTPLKTIHTQIGVKKVTLPEYLNSNKILVKEGNKVKELDANLIAYPDSLFTQKTIELLKKRLNNPNVFLYPWDVKKKKGFIVDIVIDDYLYSNGFVHLKGSYHIKKANGKVIAAKNFFLKKESLNTPESIIKTLNELFVKLIDEIAQKIAR
jgi:uncharacterized lipoprotein YmbA